MAFFEIPPSDSVWGTRALLPVTGEANLYWPMQIGHNLNFLASESNIIQSVQFKQGMSGSKNWLLYLEAGTYSFNWTVRTPASDDEPRLTGTLNGTTVFKVKMVDDSNPDHINGPGIYSLVYNGFVVASAAWITLTYWPETAGDWDIEMAYCFSAQSRWWQNWREGANLV